MALVLAPEPPLAAWLRALDAQIARAPNFFDSRPVIVDLAALPREQPDIAELLQMLAERGIRIIGTEGAHPHWEGVSRWGGPILANPKTARPVEPPREPVAPAASAPVRAVPPAPPPAQPSSGDPSLLLTQPLRSGQQIIHEAGDVTVIGSVASGAEIVAGGSIHVYGALRGRAIAGLSGSKQARIFCSRLHAELLAIDGVYKTADDMEAALHGEPVQAWLDGERMRLARVD